MSTESFDEELCIESAEDVKRLSAALDSKKKVDPSTFDYHDEEDKESIKEIYG